MPESFEFIILKSGIVDIDKDIQNNTAEYADSRQFESWEQYYTAVLTEATKDGDHPYSKHRLHAFYLRDDSKKSIIEVIPLQIRP